MANKKTIGISELIEKVKQDLLLQFQESSLFFVEEVNLEISYTVSGDINSGFDLGIVTLGSEVSEQRIQKVNIKLSPIFSKEELKKLKSKEEIEKMAKLSSEALYKGGGHIK